VHELRMPAPRRRPLVWIVDDSPTEALIAERSLGTTYDFECFVDGSVVVERLAAGAPQPDLVLLDWVMPGMAGDEVCRFLRADSRTADLPIILITASRIETGDVAKGLAIGANDYVARPFANEELCARVASAIRAKELGDLARQERRRLATINGLGRALLRAGTEIQHILEELAVALTESISDGCSILLMPASGVSMTVTRHNTDSSGEALANIASVTDPVVHVFESSQQARASLPPAYASYVDRFGLRGLAIMPFPSRDLVRGIVTVTRDGGSDPFDNDDLDTVTACIEYASLAVESAVRFEADRLGRARTAHFQQQMLGIVGHDLRAPLGAILIGTELLETDVSKDPAAVSVVKRIGTSALRMRRMVDQLLDMTRARLGDGIPVERSKTQLRPIISSVLEELAMTHANAKFELVAGVDVTGLWDPDRLGQAMSNLLSNALQYGRDGAPIVIELGTIEGAATITVHNTVRDQPIPPESLATLFEPYRRGADDVRHNTSGLGLGLYIVYEIVRAHGGSITASSETSRTSFRVVLPAG
jgi:phosphoserine phosphatase RsbU/P